ncbi:MAG: nuclear transport factor 2 family protein [Candidatus Binatia bacterium]
MSETTNLEIIKEAYAAFGRGDIPAVLSVEDPDTELECAGPKDIPWAGSFRGHDGVKKYFAAIEAEADFDVFEPQTFLADGDKVVVLGFERVRSKRTGRSYEGHWAHVFTMAGGKITKFREYPDTAAVAAAFSRG